MRLNSLSEGENTMSILEVKLNKSLSDDWQVARAVFEESHKIFGKVVHLKTIRTSTEDEFEAHVLDVHRRCCEACPSLGGGLRGVPDRDAAAVRAADDINTHKRKIYVSTYTQTTCGYGILQIDALDMLDDSVSNDKDKDIRQTSVLLSTTCRGGSPEKSSNKRDVTSYLERTNQDLGLTVKDKRDFQDHGDVDMDSRANGSTSHQRLIKEEIPSDGTDMQSHLERANQASDRPLKHERDSEDVDIESSRNEATCHQGLEEENGSQHIISCVQSPVERTNPASDGLIKQGNPQDGCVNSSKNEAISLQRLEEEMPIDGSHGIKAILESNSEPSDPTRNRDEHSHEGQSSEQSHADGKTLQEDTNMPSCSTNNCDVQIHDDNCQDLFHALTDSYKKDQSTSGSEGKKPFQCPSCNKIYSYRNAFHKHLKTHSKPEHYQEVMHPTRSEDEMTVHVETNMPSSSTNNCDIHSHDDNCQDLCHAGMNSYKKDQNTTESGGKKPFQCPSCNKRYSYKNAFHTHLRTHSKPKHYQEGKRPTSSEGNKSFHCSDCHKRYSGLNEYYKHLSTHAFQKPYQCSICGQKFTHKDHINRHMMMHSEEKLSKRDCFSNSCSQKGRFKIQMRTCTGEKPFKCDYCSYRSDKKINLQGHMRTHTREKPFKCGNCTFKCSKKENLQVHMRTHTAEKPFNCDFCRYRCCQKSHLEVHMRTHTGDKPHQCSLCGKRFCQTGQLKRHMKTHAGAKPR